MRWHRAVRNVVALNSMRPPPEPVPEEDGAESEEERKPAPGQQLLPASLAMLFKGQSP